MPGSPREQPVPRPYPPEFRRRALDLVRSGRTVREVAASLGIPEPCLHRWRHRDLVDRGLKPGRTAQESAELAAGRQNSQLARLARGAQGCATERSQCVGESCLVSPSAVAPEHPGQD